MIDPNAVTDIRRTNPQLEEFLLFCICVAGKNADQQTRKLEAFLEGRTPFKYIRSLGPAALEARLKAVKLGKYSLLCRSFRTLATSGIDLRTCSLRDLTAFPGVGIKTAKFFVLHSRPREMHGVLDTHVLSWMREQLDGRTPRGIRVPRHSPQQPAVYAFWERVFFGLAMDRMNDVAVRLRSMPLRGTELRTVKFGPWAKLDLDLWRERREKD